MNLHHQHFTIAQAKEMDLVDYLSSLGYQPAKVRNADYWYLSPLREEKNPSFKVNQKLNRWYDHGLGQGGNLVDFGILYHHCTVSELLQKLEGSLSFHPPTLHHPELSQAAEKEHKITVLSDSNLSSFALLRYLEQRKIPVSVAAQYCREVRYELNDKTYYGIGFKNNSGGFEIRNPYAKLSSAPKDITTFGNSTKEAAVFEGFMDFLSFKAMHQNKPSADTDFLILNSAAFFEKARPFIEQHETIKLYLDRDTTGQNCSRHALELSPKYRDESSLYKTHKDLNDWLVNVGSNQKKRVRQKLR